MRGEELQPMTFEETCDNNGTWLRDNLSKEDLSEVRFGLVWQTVGYLVIFSVLAHNFFIVLAVAIITIIQYQCWVEMHHQMEKHKNFFDNEQENER